MYFRGIILSGKKKKASLDRLHTILCPLYSIFKITELEKS